MKPPFTYFGGKTLIADRIAALLPPHEHYVEPFAGSLAVLLAKPPSPMETVNDLDQKLMTFWRVLRDQPAEFERVCALTPHSRAEHQAAYEPAEPELEQARRTWVLLTQGRSGHVHQRSGWRHYQGARGSSASMPDYLDGYTGRIAVAAARLRGVSLECRPALEVIASYGRHECCLVYADPPYLRSVRTWTSGPAYGFEMYDEGSHRELAAALSAARAAVVVSGYRSELYDKLYDGWHRTEISTQARNGKDRARIEVLWSNRPFPQGSLFDHMEPTA